MEALDEMLSGPPGVVTVAYDRRDALARALDSDAEWLWFLADGARPRDDALERLLEAARLEDAAPATVLAGLLVNDRGEPLDESAQAAPRFDATAAIRFVRQRVLPIRNAGFSHCLVARSAFGRHGIPDARRFGCHAPVEWTARALRHEAGYLVPGSVVVVSAPEALSGRGTGLSDLAPTLRMLRTGTWTRGEAVSAMRRCLLPG